MVPAQATRVPGMAQGTAVPVCCAVAAQEGAVREGFLEKASVQAHMAHMAHGSESGNENKSRKVGAVEEWSQLKRQQAEGTGEHQHAAPLTQEWVRDEAEMKVRPRPRNSELCPQGRDWPGLSFVLKRWPWCPGLRQHEVGDEALERMGRGHWARVQERWGPVKAPGSGVWGRQGKIWCVLEAGGKAGRRVPSLCSVIPSVVSSV